MAPRPLTHRLGATLIAVSALLAACGPSAGAATFDPAAPCPSEGQQPGAFPDLEALLPGDLDGAPPDKVDSGRSCSPEKLGTLADRGLDEVRFAGATRKTGSTSGLTVAVFRGKGLDPGLMLEFYETGARDARRTEKYVSSDTMVGSTPARRLDVLGSDGTGQTVVTWAGDEPGTVWVLLAADLGDTRVAGILEALGSR
jgi:hypothetical protein